MVFVVLTGGYTSLLSSIAGIKAIFMPTVTLLFSYV